MKTQSEINIAIAEACGWTKEKPPRTAAMGACPPSTSKVWWFQHHLPNYYHDLNACAEFEKTLSGEQKLLYVDQILSLIHEVDPGYFSGVSWVDAPGVVCATAPQRCEAFLRTVGKWIELSSGSK